MELKFLELKFHKKDFKIFSWNSTTMEKLEFPINGKSLHILETVVYCKIFSKTVVFGHFGNKKA